MQVRLVHLVYILLGDVIVMLTVHMREIVRSCILVLLLDSERVRVSTIDSVDGVRMVEQVNSLRVRVKQVEIRLDTSLEHARKMAIA